MYERVESTVQIRFVVQHCHLLEARGGDYFTTVQDLLFHTTWKKMTFWNNNI